MSNPFGCASEMLRAYDSRLVGRFLNSRRLECRLSDTGPETICEKERDSACFSSPLELSRAIRTYRLLYAHRRCRGHEAI